MAPPQTRQGHSPRYDRMRNLNGFTQRQRKKEGAGENSVWGPWEREWRKLGLGRAFCEWNNNETRRLGSQSAAVDGLLVALAMRMRTCQLTLAAQTGKTSRSDPHQPFWRAVPFGLSSPPHPFRLSLSSPAHCLSARPPSPPSPPQDCLTSPIASTLGSQVGLSFGLFPSLSTP